jgi:hypothetical protein
VFSKFLVLGHWFWLSNFKLIPKRKFENGDSYMGMGLGSTSSVEMFLNEEPICIKVNIIECFLVGNHLWAYHTIKVDTFEYTTFVMVVVDVIECVDSGFQLCFVNGLEKNTM